MFIAFDQDRPSDSPFIERVWSCHSEGGGIFSSVASPHCELVLTRLKGNVIVTLRGPETCARQVSCPPDGEWLAIRFTAGTFIRPFPATQLIDGRDVNLPQINARSFWLDGARWECPSFDNAETFVAHLAKAGVIARDTVVAAAIEGDPVLSQRSVQRRFQQVCGITHTTLRQIERARYAARLLIDGARVFDVQEQAGFYDQAHLTRSLKRYTGLTPATIASGGQQLSFLYKK